jgi:hypothetical protein
MTNKENNKKETGILLLLYLNLFSLYLNLYFFYFLHRLEQGKKIKDKLE